MAINQVRRWYQVKYIFFGSLGGTDNSSKVYVPNTIFNYNIWPISITTIVMVTMRNQAEKTWRGAIKATRRHLSGSVVQVLALGFRVLSLLLRKHNPIQWLLQLSAPSLSSDRLPLFRQHLIWRQVWKASWVAGLLGIGGLRWVTRKRDLHIKVPFWYIPSFFLRTTMVNSSIN